MLVPGKRFEMNKKAQSFSLEKNYTLSSVSKEAPFALPFLIMLTHALLVLLVLRRKTADPAFGRTVGRSRPTSQS